MFNTVPVNGWPQIKALEGVDSLPDSIDDRITAIETWIESVAPSDSDQQATLTTTKKRKKVVKNAK